MRGLEGCGGGGEDRKGRVVMEEGMEGVLYNAARVCTHLAMHFKSMALFYIYCLSYI